MKRNINTPGESRVTSAPTREYFKISNHLVDNGLAEFTRSELAVYLVLSRFANPGTVAKAGAKWIGQKAGIKSRANVIAAIRKLESRGLVKTTGTSGGWAKRNTYTLRPVKRNCIAGAPHGVLPALENECADDTPTVSPALGNCIAHDTAVKELQVKELLEKELLTQQLPESKSGGGEDVGSEGLGGVNEYLLSYFTQGDIDEFVGDHGKPHVAMVVRECKLAHEAGKVDSRMGWLKARLSPGAKTDFTFSDRETRKREQQDTTPGFVHRDPTPEEYELLFGPDSSWAKAQKPRDPSLPPLRDPLTWRKDGSHLKTSEQTPDDTLKAGLMSQWGFSPEERQRFIDDHGIAYVNKVVQLVNLLASLPKDDRRRVMNRQAFVRARLQPDATTDFTALDQQRQDIIDTISTPGFNYCDPTTEELASCRQTTIEFANRKMPEGLTPGQRQIFERHHGKAAQREAEIQPRPTPAPADAPAVWDGTDITDPRHADHDNWLKAAA